MILFETCPTETSMFLSVIPILVLKFQKHRYFMIGVWFVKWAFSDRRSSDMKQRLDLVLMSILIAMLWSSAALSNVHSQRYLYQLYAYPKSSESCHIEARRLADRFATSTGTSATGECKAIRESSFDIFIYYTGSQEIPLVSTYPNMLLQDRIHIFSTEASCRENLSTESSYFEFKTGLTPFVTYCVLDETYYGRKSWAIRIDSFGTPETRPFWAESFMLGHVDGMTESAAEALIADTFKRSGIDVRRVHLRNDPKGLRQFSMLYYNAKPLSIEIQMLASTLDSRQQCQAELATVNSVLNTTTPNTLFCAANNYVNAFEVLGVVELTSWFKSKLSVESFKTYSECSQSRDKILDTYRNTVGLDIATGLCYRTEGVWRLNLLERR
jgi:hypothetical protein